MPVPTSYTTTFIANDGRLSTSTVATSVNLPVVIDQRPSDSGLSDNEKVAIGVGLGVGIPSLLVACVGVYWQWKRHRAAETRALGNVYDGPDIFRNGNREMREPGFG
jgi:hypothetical protein